MKENYSINKIENLGGKIVSEQNNFFAQPSFSAQQFLKQESSKHLNDYDSAILNREAYKDMKDDLLKLEYKISQTEDNINEIETQIKTALETNDYVLVKTLTERRIQLNNSLKELTEIYNGASLSAKISEGITSKLKNGFNHLKTSIESVTTTIMSKMPGKVSSLLEVKDALEKLENINKSVDELMTLQIPYGESADKYRQLSNYIAKANDISNQISRHYK